MKVLYTVLLWKKCFIITNTDVIKSQCNAVKPHLFENVFSLTEFFKCYLECVKTS